MRFAFNNFVLDTEERVLWREGEAVPLSPKVFETLDLLVQSGGRIVTKQEFMSALWPDSFVEDANLTQNIFVLRKILGTSEDGRPYIETFPRRGYRFVGAVRREDLVVEAVGPGAAPAGTTVPSAEATSPETDESEREKEPSPEKQAGSTRRSLRGIALTVPAVMVLLLAGGGLAMRWSTRMRVRGYQRITNDGRAKDLPITPTILVVDGGTIYFTEFTGTQNVLAHVPAAGGEVSYDPIQPERVHVVGLAPGGIEDPKGGRPGSLLFATKWPIDQNEPLLARDLATGTVKPVFDLQAQDASWSPDGSKLAYAHLANLYVRSRDGGTRLVATVRGVAYWPRWSPDGRVLRFSESYQGFHDRLWQVDSDGGRLQQLYASQSDSDHMCCGSWTSSGRGFVYLSVETNNSRIHVRTGGREGWFSLPGQAIEIPAAPLDRWVGPVPGPDGKHVFAVGEQLRGRLVRIDPVTRRPEPFIGGISAEGLSYSPDGAEIVWTAYPDGTLWRSRSDGSGRVQLTQAPLIARFPRWSPHGSTIVFTAARPGSDWQLYTVAANGGEVKPLVAESRGQGVATWSPDGKTLAFGHLLDTAEARNQPFDLEVFHLGDRSAHTIPGSTGLLTARWSPDGRFISAVTEDGQTLRLYDVQKGTWSDLAHAPVNDVAWSPDSQSLFFDTSLGADATLYRVKLSDRKLAAWADLKDVRRAGFFEPWLGMAPDGSPVMLEDASIQELYSIAVNMP